MTAQLKHCLLWVLAVTACSANASERALVRDGQAASCIVLPGNCGPVEAHAASELALFLEKATGARVGIRNTPSPDLCNVYLGTAEAANVPRTRAMDAALPQLRDEGFLLAVDQDGVRVVGNSPVGVLYGAYGILREHAGLRWFAPGRDFEYCPRKTTLAIPDQLTVSNPSFRFRYVGSVCANTNSKTIDTWDWMVRNGMVIRTGKRVYRMHQAELEKRGAECYQGGHAFAYLLSDKLFDQSPECFGLFDGRRVPQDLGDGRGARRQPCTSNPTVADIMAESLNRYLDSPPRGGSYLIGNNDATNWCQCGNCARLDPPGEKEKRFVGTRYYTFVNRVAGIAYTTHPDADLWSWAYQNYQYPPTGVVPDKRLKIAVCVHHRCYRHAMTDEQCPANAKFRDILEGWLTFGNPVVTREYDECFPGEPPYVPTENVYCQDIKYYHKIGLSGFIPVVAPPDGTFGPRFDRRGIKEAWQATWQMRYLAARLAWNVDADTDALTEDMGSKYYGPAWPVMKRYRAELVRMYEKTPGDIVYGTPDYILGKCLEKPGVEAMLLQLLDEAEKSAARNDTVLGRVRRDREYFAMCWQTLHREFLAKRQREVNVSKRSGAILIDGVLDENDWSAAEFTGSFVTTDGKTAADPQTFVKMLYDPGGIYLAIEAMEPDPGKMRIGVSAHDGPVWTDSSLEVFVAAPGMGGRYGQLVVNPRGVTYDSMAASGNTADVQFELQSDVSTIVHGDRWIAELRIPAVTAFGRAIQDGETWKINVARNRRLLDAPSQSSSWSNGVFHGPEAFRSVSFGRTALLKNGDFEDAVAPNRYQKKTAWEFVGDNVPAHWSFHEGQPGTEALMEGGAASGRRFLRVNDGWIHQKINQSAEYRGDLLIRASARGQGVLSLCMYLYDRDTGKNIPGKTLREVAVASPRWTPIEAVYRCEDNKILRLAFWIKGEIDLDDVTVTLEPSRDAAPLR